MRRLITLGMLLLVLALAGCGENSGSAVSGKKEETLRPEEEGSGMRALKRPDQASDLHIFVDTRGYSCEDEKIAWFEGEDLGGSFRVIQTEDRTGGFSAPLEKTGFVSESGLPLWKGDFSALTEEGTYYLQAAAVGRSEIFTVSKYHYELQKDELTETWEKELREKSKPSLTDQERLALYESLYFAGVACELYPRQSPTTGEVIRQVLSEQIPEKPDRDTMTKEAASFLIAALTQGTCTGGEDKERELFEKSAKTLYGIFFTGGAKGEDMADVRAAGAMYKLTGQRGYATLPEEYLSDLKDVDRESFPVFFSYLTTKKTVDTELGSDLMMLLIRTCTEISEHAGNIPENRTEEGLQEAYYEADLLTLADSVLVSREYRLARSRLCHAQALNPAAAKEPELMTLAQQLLVIFGENSLE